MGDIYWHQPEGPGLGHESRRIAVEEAMGDGFRFCRESNGSLENPSAVVVDCDLPGYLKIAPPSVILGQVPVYWLRRLGLPNWTKPSFVQSVAIEPVTIGCDIGINPIVRGGDDSNWSSRRKTFGERYVSLSSKKTNGAHDDLISLLNCPLPLPSSFTVIRDEGWEMLQILLDAARWVRTSAGYNSYWEAQFFGRGGYTEFVPLETFERGSEQRTRLELLAGISMPTVWENGAKQLARILSEHL